MKYLAAMRSILQLSENIYPAIHRAGKAANYCMINILVFGLLHALSALYFSGALFQDPAAGEMLPAAVKIQFVAIGVGVAFLMHAAAALFIWVFSRGFGGRTAFLPVYLNLGLSLVGLWPLAPALAAAQAGGVGGLVRVFIALAGLYGLSIIFMGTKSASGLSAFRMSVAMVVTIVVVVSLMYLWT